MACPRSQALSLSASALAALITLFPSVQRADASSPTGTATPVTRRAQRDWTDDVPAHFSARRRRRRRSSARARVEAAPKRTCRCSPAIGCAPSAAASRCCSPTAARSTSTSTRASTCCRTRSCACSTGRIRLTIARATDALDYRDRRRRLAPCWIRAPATIAWRSRRGARPIPKLQRHGPARRGRARQRARPDAACAPVRRRGDTNAARRRCPTRSTPRSWDAFDRWVEDHARRAARHAVVAVSASRAALLRRHVRSLRHVGLRRRLRRLRLVPARRRRLAAVLARALVVLRELRLVLGRRRPLGVADASLRPLGPQSRALVLDSRSPLGAGVGLLGRRARLRELVPARLSTADP